MSKQIELGFRPRLHPRFGVSPHERQAMLVGVTVGRQLGAPIGGAVMRQLAETPGSSYAAIEASVQEAALQRQARHEALVTALAEDVNRYADVRVEPIELTLPKIPDVTIEHRELAGVAA